MACLRAMSRLPDWHLRQAVEADVPALAALYADTAQRMGPWCYTPQQVQAWMSFGEDLAAFRDYILGVVREPYQGVLFDRFRMRAGRSLQNPAP